MTHNEAVSKVAKLLRLSQSSNPNEAALAASRAQEIMDRFKIDSLSLDRSERKPDEEVKNFRDDPLDGQSAATWKGRLALTLAEMNQAICYKSSGKLSLIGRPSDVSTVRYIYGWLVREVDALAAKNCAGNGRTWTNNYRIGVVETVCNRLREQHAATINAVKTEATAADVLNTGLALVRVNTAIAMIEKRAVEVKQWQKQNFKLTSGGRSSYRADFTARQAGARDGYNVRLQPSRGNLGNGQRALNGC